MGVYKCGHHQVFIELLDGDPVRVALSGLAAYNKTKVIDDDFPVLAKPFHRKAGSPAVFSRYILFFGVLMSEDSTSQRLSSRGEGLSKRRGPDGGEVYSGPLAKQALDALGARAMTVDHTIIVSDDFDLHNPEDQALYAHERFHQMESGGADEGHAAVDAEELGARAIERAVLSRVRAGEDFGSVMESVMSEGASMSGASGGGPSGTAGAAAGYAFMLASGMTHEQIVEELGRHILNHMVSEFGAGSIRAAGQATFE